MQIQPFLIDNQWVMGGGSPKRPMTNEDITEKSWAQLQAFYAAGPAEQILAQCWRIEEYQRVDAFCEQLQGAST